MESSQRVNPSLDFAEAKQAQKEVPEQDLSDSYSQKVSSLNDEMMATLTVLALRPTPGDALETCEEHIKAVVALRDQTTQLHQEIKARNITIVPSNAMVQQQKKSEELLAEKTKWEEQKHRIVALRKKATDLVSNFDYDRLRIPLPDFDRDLQSKLSRSTNDYQQLTKIYKDALNEMRQINTALLARTDIKDQDSRLKFVDCMERFIEAAKVAEGKRQKYMEQLKQAWEGKLVPEVRAAQPISKDMRVRMDEMWSKLDYIFLSGEYNSWNDDRRCFYVSARNRYEQEFLETQNKLTALLKQYSNYVRVLYSESSSANDFKLSAEKLEVCLSEFKKIREVLVNVYQVRSNEGNHNIEPDTIEYIKDARFFENVLNQLESDNKKYDATCHAVPVRAVTANEYKTYAAELKATAAKLDELETKLQATKRSFDEKKHVLNPVSAYGRGIIDNIARRQAKRGMQREKMVRDIKQAEATAERLHELETKWAMLLEQVPPDFEELKKIDYQLQVAVLPLDDDFRRQRSAEESEKRKETIQKTREKCQLETKWSALRDAISPLVPSLTAPMKVNGVTIDVRSIQSQAEQMEQLYRDLYKTHKALLKYGSKGSAHREAFIKYVYDQVDSKLQAEKMDAYKERPARAKEDEPAGKELETYHSFFAKDDDSKCFSYKNVPGEKADPERKGIDFSVSKKSSSSENVDARLKAEVAAFDAQLKTELAQRQSGRKHTDTKNPSFDESMKLIDDQVAADLAKNPATLFSARPLPSTSSVAPARRASVADNYDALFSRELLSDDAYKKLAAERDGRENDPLAGFSLPMRALLQ